MFNEKRPWTTGHTLKRKIQYLAPVLKSDKYDLLKLTIEGCKINGNRFADRHQNSWMKDIYDDGRDVQQ